MGQYTSLETPKIVGKMPSYQGSCFCRNIEYQLMLNSPDDARTSLCHCRNCKVFPTFLYQPRIPTDSRRKHSEQTTA